MPKENGKDKLVVTFKKEKETENTFKYKEIEREGEPKFIGTLYVQKFVARALGDTVKVTVEKG